MGLDCFGFGTRGLLIFVFHRRHVGVYGVDYEGFGGVVKGYNLNPRPV